MTTVLITGCGGQFIVDCISCYKTESLKIIAVASELNDDLCDIVDEYIRVPVSTDENYLDILLAICKKKHVDILIPFMDCELIPLYERRYEFARAWVQLSMTLNDNLYTVTDKLKFMEAIRDAGIPCPRFWRVESTGDLLAALKETGIGRLVVKGTHGAGSRSVRILDWNFDAWDDYLHNKAGTKFMNPAQFYAIMPNKVAPMIAMEYLSGDEYGVDLLADHGKVVCIGGRRNLVVDNSIPQVSVTEKNEKAYQIAKDIVELFALDGNVNIDYIFDDKGEPMPIEVNARISATMSLFAKAGLNMAAMRIFQLEGKDIVPQEMVEGVKLKRKNIVEFEG